MENNKKLIKIFTLQQEFPCGPGAGCCGPIGQSEEEVLSLKENIEKNLDASVEIVDIKKTKNWSQHPEILKMLQSFGFGTIPIVAVGDEIACAGQNYSIDEIISEIKKIIS